MEFEDFLYGQLVVYHNFKKIAEEVKRGGGIAADPNLLNRKRYFSVVLLHSQAIGKAIEEFSSKVTASAPGIIYKHRDVHTTLGSLFYIERFRFDWTNSLHIDYLEKMADGVRDALAELGKINCVINFPHYLFNKAVVIAAGFPNRDFFRLFTKIRECCRRYGVELNPPWGAHIIVTRFTAQKKASELGDFFNLVENTPGPGLSVPEAVAVGYSMWEKSSERPDVPDDEIHGQFAPLYIYSLL